MIVLLLVHSVIIATLIVESIQVLESPLSDIII
jgi:hypothetical protein